MRIQVNEGQTLWEAMAEAKAAPERPCGGRGICGRCAVRIAGRGSVKSCRFAEPGVYEVQPGEQPEFDVIMPEEGSVYSDSPEAVAASGGRIKWREPVFLVDVGTTTVAIVAADGENRRSRTFINPQRQYGADVMSRISACGNGQQELLRELLWKRLVRELLELARESGGEAAEGERSGPERGPLRVYMAGNTTMLHILRGYPCEGLGRAPFTPVSLEAERLLMSTEEGTELDLHLMPGISAFVGADIVSGLYGLQMEREKRLTLFLDLGTNGEMALGNRDGILCTSAAAGPALEASEAAVRLHASGLFRALGRMLEDGVMDTYGTLAEPWFSEGYLLTGDAGGERRLLLSQQDIRDIQMAKAAVAAGIGILMKEYGAEPKDIEQVYLAGGMGYYLDPADAAAVGILPRELSEKAAAVGNSCLAGLYRFSVMDGKGEKPLAAMKGIIHGAREVILADHPDFQERYIEKMNF